MFCRVCSHTVFQFFVALSKRFPTSSNSLKNAMAGRDEEKTSGGEMRRGNPHPMRAAAKDARCKAKLLLDL